MDIKKASIINAAGKYSKVVLSVFVSAILARILSVEDYGVVAIITVFSTFFTTLSDMGFGAAIIQNKELTEEDVDSIYSVTVYISFILMFLFALLSYPIAVFYGDSVYIPLGLLLSVSLLFNAMNMVPNGILNRDKKFVSIAFRTVVVYVGAAIVTIILALNGARYYALVIQSILSAFFTFIWNYATTRPHFHFRFNPDSIKKVLNYSGYQFAFNIVNYFSRNLDNLLTGKIMGSAELGYYSKAYSLMLYPVNYLSGVVSPVLHPILSDYQKEIKIIYQKYLKVIKLLMCIAIYVAPVCYLASYEIINILYGSNWNDSVICFQMLAIAILPQMVNSPAGAVFQALGNTKLLFINSVINTCITVVAILLGVFVGGNIASLSLCVGVAYIIHFLTASYMLIEMGFGFKLNLFVKDLFKEWLMLFIMIIAVMLYPFQINNVFLSAILKSGYLGVIYVIMLGLTGEIKLYLSLLKKQ